jgi:protein SCO1/2
MSITPRRPGRRGLLVAGALAAAALAGTAGWLAWSADSGGSLEPRIGGAFSLTDGDGRTVTDRDLRGRYLLVYFGYTSCPDVCPTTLNEIAGALQDLGGAGRRLTPVFISVDPARDTPSVVRSYVAAFSPRIVGLTGSAQQIASVAREYRVYYAKGGDGANYTVNHSSLLYLMAPDGRFVAPIRADQDAASLAADLRPYLA